MLFRSTVLRTLPTKEGTVAPAVATDSENPSPLPSDQEIRSTVQEDSPSEGSSDDADS